MSNPNLTDSLLEVKKKIRKPPMEEWEKCCADICPHCRENPYYDRTPIPQDGTLYHRGIGTMKSFSAICRAEKIRRRVEHEQNQG